MMTSLDPVVPSSHIKGNFSRQQSYKEGWYRSLFSLNITNNEEILGPRNISQCICGRINSNRDGNQYGTFEPTKIFKLHYLCRHMESKPTALKKCRQIRLNDVWDNFRSRCIGKVGDLWDGCHHGICTWKTWWGDIYDATGGIWNGDSMCHLLRSLYDLKQAARVWNQKIHAFL